MIIGSIPKPAGASTAFVKAVSPTPATLPTQYSNESWPINLSPGRCAEVRMKNFSNYATYNSCMMIISLLRLNTRNRELSYCKLFVRYKQTVSNTYKVVKTLG